MNVRPDVSGLGLGGDGVDLNRDVGVFALVVRGLRCLRDHRDAGRISSYPSRSASSDRRAECRSLVVLSPNSVNSVNSV